MLFFSSKIENKHKKTAFTEGWFCCFEWSMKTTQLVKYPVPVLAGVMLHRL